MDIAAVLEASRIRKSCSTHVSCTSRSEDSERLPDDGSQGACSLVGKHKFLLLVVFMSVME